jgi:hypothetical protein
MVGTGLGVLSLLRRDKLPGFIGGRAPAMQQTGTKYRKISGSYRLPLRRRNRLLPPSCWALQMRAPYRLTGSSGHPAALLVAHQSLLSLCTGWPVLQVREES